MKSAEIFQALEYVKNSLTEQGYNVAYICLYGSQNYNLDVNNEEYQSDLDVKAVIIPTLDDLVSNATPVSKVKDTMFGQVDIKDIRLFIQSLRKANPSYIECLFTKYYLTHDNTNIAGKMRALRANAEDLCKAQDVQMVKAMYGMMKEKQKSLCHPYPSIAHKIEEFGYCGKQLSHAARLYIMLKRWNEGKYMQECLWMDKIEKDMLMHYKLNKPSLEEAKQLMDEFVHDAKILVDEYIQKNKDLPKDDTPLILFENIQKYAIKNNIISDIHDEALQNAINTLSRKIGKYN